MLSRCRDRVVSPRALRVLAGAMALIHVRLHIWRAGPVGVSPVGVRPVVLAAEVLRAQTEWRHRHDQSQQRGEQRHECAASPGSPVMSPRA